VTVTCPQCGASGDLDARPACGACQWVPEESDGVTVLLTAADRTSPILASYFRNYDQIASDDLAAPILDLHYVQRQAANLAGYAGDVTGKAVLDLGCGQGYLTRALLAKGASRVVAADISMAYLRRLADVAGVTPVLVNAETLPFVDAFDLIVSTDVMEHVLNLGSCLVSMNRSARMGGRVIVRVPYRESLLGYSAQAGCKYEFVHLRTFNRGNLHEALAAAGFEVERTWLDGFSVFSPQAFWMAGPGRKALYIKLQVWVLSKLATPADVTRWPWLLAAALMRPKEIVVRARKTRNVEL
jgi:SAM-dependent methyltransferase